MTTKRDQFRQWLESNHLHSGVTAEKVADAAARIFEGPGEAKVLQSSSGLFFCTRNTPKETLQFLDGKGEWSFDECDSFDTRAEAETALAKLKGTDQ